MAQRQPLNTSTSVMQSRFAEESKEVPKFPGEISLHDIQIKKLLTCGNIFSVYLGNYANEKVIVKTKNDTLEGLFGGSGLREEWNVLLKSFASQSRYVVRPIGYCEEPLTIVMEYVKNGDLEFFMKKAQLTLAQKISIANDIALGILDLLAIGIAHRDIKTANILITNDLHAKICDFDKSNDSSIKVVGLQGTTEYLAPEYFVIKHYFSNISLPAADVFSFGVLLVELFSRQEDFAKYSKLCDKGVLYNVKHPEKRMSMLTTIIDNNCNHWPAELRQVIISCLEENASKRPSMKDIQQRLHEMLIAITSKNDKDSQTRLSSVSILSHPSATHVVEQTEPKKPNNSCSLM